LEDTDEGWCFACSRIVLLLDALALSGLYAVADPGGPFARVLAVAGVKREVEVFLVGRKRLECTLDIG
jgi:hypothetical protein